MKLNDAYQEYLTTRQKLLDARAAHREFVEDLAVRVQTVKELEQAARAAAAPFLRACEKLTQLVHADQAGIIGNTKTTTDERLTAALQEGAT